MLDTARLRDRYPAAAATVVPAAHRARLASCGDPDALAWEVLYRLEPELFDRLVAGEALHPGVLGWIEGPFGRAVEVGAGTGRLTAHLAARCGAVVAVDAAAPMLERLVVRAPGFPGGGSNVRAVAADACAIPLPDGWADAVFTCATVAPRPAAWADGCLRELERVCRPAGIVVAVWPHTPDWLCSHGYRRVEFPGPMAHEFASPAEALELARVFYPDRADAVAALGSASIPYEVLGINAPRDLAWKVVG